MSPGPARRAKVVAAAGSVATFLVALVGFARQGPPPAATQVQAGDAPAVTPSVPADPFTARPFRGRFGSGFGSGQPDLEPHTTTRGS